MTSGFRPDIGVVGFRRGVRDGELDDLVEEAAPLPGREADPRDFLQLTGALWRAASGLEDRSQPMLALILDGLSTQRQR